MKTEISKINTYINFAIKSGDCVFGVDKILKTKPYLIIYHESLANNSLNKIKTKLHDVLIVMLNEVFDAFVDKDIKVLAICNKNLANACIEILRLKGLLGGITVE